MNTLNQEELDDYASEFIVLALTAHRNYPDLKVLDNDAKLVCDELRKKSHFICPSNLRDRAECLADKLSAQRCNGTAEVVRNRHYMLSASARALAYILKPRPLGEGAFDEYVREVFDLKAPTPPLSSFENISEELGDVFSGKGSIADQYHAWLAMMTVPKGKETMILEMAMEEARNRTVLPLPRHEHCRIDGIEGVNFRAYLTFEGNSCSLMQYSKAVPLYAHDILSLVCHEVYPGHHTFCTIREAVLQEHPGRVENACTVLQSPVASIMEGTAEAAVDLVFPGSEYIEFESKLLAQLGIPGDQSTRSQGVRAFNQQAWYAKRALTRALLEGEKQPSQAEEWLVNHCLVPPCDVRLYVNSYLEYGPYMATYSGGREIVEAWLAREPKQDVRWTRFGDLLNNPSPASALST
jgi:hypothetical protein